MSDPPDAPQSNASPDRIPMADVQPARRSFLERVSVVWLVPLGALLLAMGLAWQAYTDRGPVIEITFSNGSGIAAGETDLRFRDITVGRVEQVGFTEGLERVLVTVRLDQNVADYVDDGAIFWVVRPELTVEGVSGLSTVLSGEYIEGSWDSEPGGLVARFDGLDETPVARPDLEGTRIVLRTASGRGLTAGAPILYRGLEVGSVGNPRIATDGISVLADAFIQAPQNELLTDRTRFWSSSGFSFNIGTAGASIDFESISTLIRGGISFDTVVAGGDPIPDGAAFDIYAGREEAVASLFSEVDENVPRLNLTAVFQDSVAGLDIGAPVELRGLNIGEVTDLTGQVDPDRFGDDRIRLVAVLSIRLDELVMGAGAGDQDDVLDFLESGVAEGLRARLTNASLLTGGLKVELTEVAAAPPAQIDRTAQPFPVFPTAPGEVRDMAGAAQGLLARINNLPVEEVFEQVVGFFEDARSLINDSEFRQVDEQIAGLLDELRAVVGSEAVQALPERIGSIAANLDATLQRLQEREGVDRLVEAVEAAGEAARQIAAGAEGLPELVERISSVAETAQGLPLGDLVAEAEGLVSDARGLVGSDAAQALPTQLGQALDGLDGAVREAQGVLSDLRAQDSVTALTAALDAAAVAGADVSAAVQGIPALVTDLQTVAQTAGNLALEDLVDQAGGLVADARGILGSEDAQALPGQLGQTLDGLDGAVREAQGVLSDLRAQDSVTALTAALDAAAAAGADVSSAVEGIPALVSDLQTVAQTASTLALEDLVDQAGGLVTDARGILGTEAAQGLPAELSQAISALGATVDEARQLFTDLTEQESVLALNTALDAAAVAAGDVSTAVDEIPELVEELQSVAQTAGALDLDTLVDQAAGLVADARIILGDEATRALPGQLGQAIDSLALAVDEARGILSDLDTQGSVAALNVALEATAQAAEDVSASVAGVPDLVAQIEAVAARAETLEVEELIDEVSGLAAAARAVLDSDEARALPGQIGGALEEVDGTLEDLRAGGTVENVNATLAAARRAADGIAGAADDLPTLVARTTSVLAQAQAVLATLDESGSLNREARTALREVSRAADAVRSLARAIERRPNSLITGR